MISLIGMPLGLTTLIQLDLRHHILRLLLLWLPAQLQTSTKHCGIFAY